MRETPKTAGLYFLISGLYGLGIAVVSLQFWRHHRWIAALESLNLILSLGYIGVGATLPELLAKNPALPARLAKLSIVVSTLSLNIVSALFSYSILVRVRKLTLQADIQPESRVLR
jgi:hypothetical protein